MISITPLFTLDSKVPSLFAYIKTNTTKLTESKAAWRRLVFMGALAVVLTTSLIIFISFQMLIFRRIIRSADFVERVREGDLETLLTAPGSDEFGTLERGMTEMVANLKRRQDQQTKAEEALRHSETRLLQAQDIARIGHFVLDTKTNGVIYRSDVICDIYGISSDEAPSTFAETLEFIHPDDRARVAAASKAAGAADEGYDVEYRIVRPDGEIRYVQEIANPERDETGTTVRSVGTFKDITVRKRAEEEILRLNESLEQRVEERTAKLLEAHEALVRQERLATLGGLTATVSHELRNPLGALRSAIAVIKRLAGDDPPLLQESAEIADRSISRCDGIIADLLDYSRTQPLNLQTAPIDDWLGRLLDEYETPEGVALVRELDGDMEIAFDHDRLRRALINLMDNACQAMVGNGVPAKAGHGDESILTIATRIENGLLELIIGDTGPGIPHDERAKVFEPLHSTKNFGVGLGLPIVRQIVEMHGGDITIDGEAGEGAHFTLRLPLDLRKDQFVVREPQAPRDAPPRRVLIVGDDRDFADSLRNFLMLKSYEVVVAYGADQAKAEANAFEPQVAIIDYRLGHTVGLDLVAPLTHRCPGIICLLATAHSDQDTAISALRSGIRDYLKMSRTRFPWTQNWLNRSVQGGPEHDRQF